MGIASFVMAIVPGIFLVILVVLILLLASAQPPGADETGFGAAVILLVLMTLLSEIVALGLGIAGAFQRSRKRSFAFLGIASSILIMVSVFAQNWIFPA